MRSEITPIHRILFVCMGNICRSPAAEGVMQSMAAEADAEGERGHGKQDAHPLNKFIFGKS